MSMKAWRPTKKTESPASSGVEPSPRIIMTIRLAAILSATLLATSAAYAQTYPVKPVRVIITFPAGGATDIVGRILSAKMQEALGQPFLVENRAGANGNIGADFVAKAPADGYTLFHADLSTLTIGPAVYPKLPFDPIDDFTPITLLVNSPHGIAVNPNFKAQTLAQFIDFARANPGKVNYAHLGNGSASHLAGIELGARAGVNFTFIPYKGGAPALADVAGGQADALAIAMVSTYPYVRGGKLRLLSVTGPNRLPFIPEVPTAIELGYPGFVAGQVQGMFGPKGLPKEIVTRLNTELLKILGDADMRKRISDLGAEVTPSTPEGLGRFVVEQKARWAKIVKDHNVKVD
jgi:tripartite-type tricarboxylate transporter receptor subunit TctC